MGLRAWTVQGRGRATITAMLCSAPARVPETPYASREIERAAPAPPSLQFRVRSADGREQALGHERTQREPAVGLLDQQRVVRGTDHRHPSGRELPKERCER